MVLLLSKLFPLSNSNYGKIYKSPLFLRFLMTQLLGSSNDLTAQLSRLLEDRGLLQNVSTMLQRYFPDTVADIEQQTPSSMVLEMESGYLLLLARLTEEFGGTDGDLRARVERTIKSVPAQTRSFLDSLPDFLEATGYHRRTPLDFVNQALDTARAQCRSDLNHYAILGDLGDGVSDSWWFHNPEKPGDWGYSTTNVGIMDYYRKSLPAALEKYRIDVSSATLTMLLVLPYNGAQAAELVKFTIGHLVLEEEGSLSEPQIDYEPLEQIEDPEESRQEYQNLAAQELPARLLAFAKERGYYNAQRETFFSEFARSAPGGDDFFLLPSSILLNL